MPPSSRAGTEYCSICKPFKFASVKSDVTRIGTEVSKYFRKLSSKSIREIPNTSNTMAAPVPQKSLSRLVTTKLASPSITRLPMPLPSGTLAGKIAIKAGNKVTERTKAAMTPVATMFPSKRNGPQSSNHGHKYYHQSCKSARNSPC